MSDIFSQRAKEIFEEARQLPPQQRERYLEHACGEDAELRAQLRALLEAHSATGGFLESPTFEPAEHAGPDSKTRAAEESPGTVIGRYKLLQPIGEGGFGRVFMAEQTEPVVRKVALKIIKLGMDTRQVIARFEAERQALAMMDHPNIAKVLDAGATPEGRPFFVMELVRGEPITDYCDKNNLDVPQRLELFSQVCNAVQHAHQKGIIHRDIKPTNVLVTMADGKPVPKVIDFGIAKATSARLTEKTLFTEFRHLIGTPAYMSPEQAEASGVDIDTRSDIYSLGVLLYELLTGTTPFDPKRLHSAAYAEIQRIIREEEPPKPSTRLSTLETLPAVAAQRHTEPAKLSKTIRGDLDWIVMKCLEKDRTRRYETASALAEEIRRHPEDEPVVAGPPSAAYRVKKFVRRNKGQVLAASVVAAALVLGMAGTSLGMAWALREKDRADNEATAAKRAEGEASAARDAENARVDELLQVTDFHANMLLQVDATMAGIRLTEGVNRRFVAALEKANLPEAERATLSDEFRQHWTRVNATDAATAFIDETILTPAVKAIDEQFKDQPVVAAQLRQALAQLYKSLGLYEAASPLEASALEIFRRLLGPDHRKTLGAISRMGVLLSDQGKLAEAEPYCREVLEKYRRVLGEQHPDTLGAISNMGALLYAQGKIAEAEVFFREALEGQRRTLGDEHPDTLDSINNVGALLQGQGKLTEAEPYCREALEGMRRTWGNEHPRTLRSISNMAFLLIAQRKVAEAEPYYREALEGMRRTLGNEHPDTLTSINNMGALLQGQGKLNEAETYFREALEGRRRALKDGHPDTLWSINALGVFVMGQGRLTEAEQLFRAGAEAARQNLGEHPLTAVLEHHQAEVLQAMGRVDEALDLALQALDRYERHPDWSSDEKAHSRAVAMRAFIASGRAQEAGRLIAKYVEEYAELLPPDEEGLCNLLIEGAVPLLGAGTREFAREAESFLRQCLVLREKILPDDHPDAWLRCNTMSLLGEALALQERYAEAEPLLIEGERELVARAGQIPAEVRDLRVSEARRRLVKLYEAWEKAEPVRGYEAKARKWQALADGQGASSRPSAE